MKNYRKKTSLLRRLSKIKMMILYYKMTINHAKTKIFLNFNKQSS